MCARKWHLRATSSLLGSNSSNISRLKSCVRCSALYRNATPFRFRGTVCRVHQSGHRRSYSIRDRRAHEISTSTFGHNTSHVLSVGACGHKFTFVDRLNRRRTSAEAKNLRSVSRVTLVLAVGLSVQQFSRAVVAQECSLARYVGRVPGREGARFSPSISADEFQVRETGNSTRSLRGTAQAPGKADSTGDPVLGRDRYPLYRLRSGDQLEVYFTFSPELNQALNIAPDGYLRLKGAGISMPKV